MLTAAYGSGRKDFLKQQNVLRERKPICSKKHLAIAVSE